MALQKQNVNINFGKGIDTKTDPFQLPIGKFQSLTNSVFSETGRLDKRPGFDEIATLPDNDSEFLTTFSGNLTAIGSGFNAYSKSTDSWVTKGNFRPLQLSTLRLVSSNTNQTQCDAVVAPNGLVCTVFSDLNNSTTTYKYVIADSTTGQNIVAPTAIPVSSGTVTGSPRVFLLERYFVIVFNNVITAVNHVQYVAISIANPTTVTANTNISSQYTPSSNVAFDGVVANNTLYLAWNGNDGGGAIRYAFLTGSLTLSSVADQTGKAATIMSVCSDNSGSTPNIYITFYNSATNKAYCTVLDANLSTITAFTELFTASGMLNFTATATGGVANIYYEVDNAYSWDSSIKSNLVSKLVFTRAGSIPSNAVLLRSVGLASKAFILNDVSYVLLVYSSSNQPTYFLSDSSGNLCAKLAYQNASGYLSKGLPNVTVTDSVAQISYLFKDMIEPVNKTQGASINGVYSQTGVALATLDISTTGLHTAELGKDLHVNGGFLWMYDGYLPVEHGFHLWPDSVNVATSGSGGLITAQQYFYAATYEWSDNQGNIFRSAPSIPVSITTTGTTSTNTIKVPTLRLTYKTANPVKIVVYRWSAAQQTYYQVTSLTAPTLNDTTADSVTITDILADSAIIGNSILYTTGGVVENIAPPALKSLSIFKSRLGGISAEDGNTLFYSKQVIQGVPVEMSDLFSLYVSPTIGAQGDTGPMRCLAAMDDKWVIFKDNAIYYITGNGPDNTGANNDFSEPIFITATVGCSDQNSIVFIPKGLMFKSDKGIWLLGRDLSTSYVGFEVESYNDLDVLSAVNAPGTNEVRFTLSNGLTIVYDYFYEQWNQAVGVSAISSTLYESKHTYIDQYGRAFQQNPESYLDGSNPVLMSFTTGWINLAGLQGYERAYYFYLLGQFLSPHKLMVQISYDYAPSPSQSVLITPPNYNANWGGDETWGQSSPWGGTPSLEQWRIFFQQQRCQAFQISVQEIFDSTYGVPAGAGLTLSGINMVVGIKKGWTTIKSNRSAG